ncbi:acetyltransferase [Bacillus sp. FJAT-27225]|uniref:GNAT family N-acetyltransferase n=1 Tax=Bacillus sp. FJAT-27225 TaxID=1743144 RepID=UPI00080C3314|nr:GNAT family N-acetyltransferase [Bacillus sp. FJAT-27225]OCA90546.1 acetyltransferase [Bacillus sp. FJAT-27225]
MMIRDAKKSELALIRAQRLAAYMEHAGKIQDGHWNELKKAISSEADQQPGVELIVAELEGKIAGSVAMFPANSDAYEGHLDELEHPEIRVLAVEPDYRGKGVGKALVGECIKRARAKGYRAVGLHTGSFMDDAMKLYEGLGFERQPELDFEPANDGIIVKAYQMKL